MMLSPSEREFVLRRRIGHLATVGSAQVPTVVPVCFALAEGVLYTAVDGKTKRTRDLRRLRDLEENPHVAFSADRYDEDWSALGWVMMRGRGDVLESGAEFEQGCQLLRSRYVQYLAMTLGPVIALRIVEVRSWGDLDG